MGGAGCCWVVVLLLFEAGQEQPLVLRHGGVQPANELAGQLQAATAGIVSAEAPPPPPLPARRRHLYASTQPSIEQRVDSWHNYRELFSGARPGLLPRACLGG